MNWSILLTAGFKNIATQVGDEDIRWDIKEEHISDPTQMVIYLSGSTPYHRHGTWDDSVAFLYRVLPKMWAH